MVSARKEIDKEAKKLIGKHVIWKDGKYKGRVAKIVNYTCDDYDGEVTVLVATYKINGEGGFVKTRDWQHRHYISLDNFKERRVVRCNYEL